MQVFQIDASLPFARRACQSKAKAAQVTGAGFVVLLADVAGNRKQLAGLGAERNAVFTEGLVLDLRNLRFDSQRVAGVVETTEFRTDRAAQAGVGAIADAKIVMLAVAWRGRSEEHTSELQSLMRISYAVFCLKKKKNKLTTKIRKKRTNT